MSNRCQEVDSRKFGERYLNYREVSRVHLWRGGRARLPLISAAEPGPIHGLNRATITMYHRRSRVHPPGHITAQSSNREPSVTDVRREKSRLWLHGVDCCGSPHALLFRRTRSSRESAKCPAHQPTGAAAQRHRRHGGPQLRASVVCSNSASRALMSS
jgi:hypothetical protein